MQLGEHGGYEKHTNFDWSTRAPWIIYHPKYASLGKKFVYKSALEVDRAHYNPPKPKVDVEEVVEFVDLFPTLVEAANLPPIKDCQHLNNVGEPLCMEGQSRWNLARGKAAPPDQTFMAFSQVHRYSAF